MMSNHFMEGGHNRELLREHNTLRRAVRAVT